MVSVRNGTFTPTNNLRTNRRCGSAARGDEKNGTARNPQPKFATSLETGRAGLGDGVACIWLSYIISQGDHRKVRVREWGGTTTLHHRASMRIQHSRNRLYR